MDKEWTHVSTVVNGIIVDIPTDGKIAADESDIAIDCDFRYGGKSHVGLESYRIIATSGISLSDRPTQRVQRIPQPIIGRLRDDEGTITASTINYCGSDLLRAVLCPIRHTSDIDDRRLIPFCNDIVNARERYRTRHATSRDCNRVGG